MKRLDLSGRVAAILLIVFSAVLVGCSGVDPDPITSIPQVSSFAPSANEYRLQQGDNVKVVVLGQQAISGDYAIDDNGAIDVSNVGLVAVAGMTVKEAETRLTEKLASGIVEQPQVSVLLDTKQSASQ